MHILDRFFNGKVYDPVLNERPVFSGFDPFETTPMIIGCPALHGKTAIAMPASRDKHSAK